MDLNLLADTKTYHPKDVTTTTQTNKTYRQEDIPTTRHTDNKTYRQQGLQTTRHTDKQDRPTRHIYNKADRQPDRPGDGKNECIAVFVVSYTPGFVSFSSYSVQFFHQ